ncbi:MAG TPA: lytic transglycosylase domain-containing protein [Thermoanaerobaculia bacterium]|nr:lytic transglycosylase domain-containing protein [Thermoanaerobaculia bacterium]
MKNVFLLSVALALTACGPVTATTPTPATTPSAPAASRSELAQLPHERIDYHIARFTGEKRAEFASYLERKQQYESMITEKLRRRGMPEDLLYLAMIESGFNPQARSLAEARGIWQLLADTARRYGLRVDEEIDERNDPEKATDAALSYLSYLYNRFGSWYLAAAAYNTGENRVGRLMTETFGRETGSDEDYYRIWDQLPGETRDFVPAMVAAAKIGKEPGRYGF